MQPTGEPVAAAAARCRQHGGGVIRWNLDFVLYGVHAAFWIAFGIARRLRGSEAAASGSGTATTERATASFSRTTLAIHFLAFAAMYAGIGRAVFPDCVAHWFIGQRLLGTIIMAAGAWLACWSLLFFRSWRFRAAVEAGHELATDGPYAVVRHPIYAGLNLLALGTAVWAPNMLTWAAVVLMVVGSDLRGRAEEGVLRRAFGLEYDRYCARTRRFLPRIY